MVHYDKCGVCTACVCAHWYLYISDVFFITAKQVVCFKCFKIIKYTLLHLLWKNCDALQTSLNLNIQNILAKHASILESGLEIKSITLFRLLPSNHYMMPLKLMLLWVWVQTLSAHLNFNSYFSQEYKRPFLLLLMKCTAFDSEFSKCNR